MLIATWFYLSFVFFNKILITLSEVDPALLEIFERLQREQYKHRCTRRFTPGDCMEPMKLVWMFDFQGMNCTERLGCTRSYRTNRFMSYEYCMYVCKPLVNLYLQILSYGSDTEGPDILRTNPSSSINRNSSLGPTLDLLQDKGVSDIEYLYDEPIESRLEYADDAHARGIDYVPVPKERHDYEYVH